MNLPVRWLSILEKLPLQHEYNHYGSDDREQYGAASQYFTRIFNKFDAYGEHGNGNCNEDERHGNHSNPVQYLK